MSRITAIDPSSTTGSTHDTLAAVGKLLGGIPNLFRVAARSPAALEALVGLNGALARGTPRAGVRHGIALAVAQTNGCDYCLSAHTVLGGRVGMSESDMALARDASAGDAKTAALLRFARTLVVERGRIGDTELAAVRAAGASDGEIVELVANVALDVFTNYSNLVADTDIDFPVVRSQRQP